MLNSLKHLLTNSIQFILLTKKISRNIPYLKLFSNISVYRRPKRMLTPGPQRPKYCCNPRFQALINRFENQGMTMARTPVNNRADLEESTPPVGVPSNMQARAINFKDDSPIIEADHSKESNELFRTCLDSPGPINNAITALTANIAGSLQNCLASALRTNANETEIQFKFVISKKTVTVQKAAEKLCEDENVNIWSTVAKAVRNVFWRDQSSLGMYFVFIDTLALLV